MVKMGKYVNSFEKYYAHNGAGLNFCLYTNIGSWVFSFVAPRNQREDVLL